MANVPNNPNKAGKHAGKAEFFGECSRYAVYPVHTRFDRVQWFISDAEKIDAQGLATVIGQYDTREGAIRHVEMIPVIDEIDRIFGNV